MKKRLFALCLALLLTAQLVLPAAADTVVTEPTEPTTVETTVPEIPETSEPTEAAQAPTEAAELPTEAPADPPSEPETLPEDPEADVPEDEASVQADPETEPLDASGTCGDDLTWTLANGTLTVSGTGDMWDYFAATVPTEEDPYQRRSTAPWGTESIQQLVIEKGVTSIGRYAFIGQDRLLTLTLPEGMESIGESSFENCYNLGSVRLPEGLKEIGGLAFSNCFVEELYIPASLTTLGERAFTGNGLTTLEIAPGNEMFLAVDLGLYSKDMTRLYIQHWIGKTAVIPDSVQSMDMNVLLSLSSDPDLEALLIGAQCNFQDLIERFPLGYLDLLKEIQVSEANPYYTAKDGVLFTKDGTTLLSYPHKREGSFYQVPDGTEVIAAEAMSHLDDLQTLLLPESLRQLDAHAVSAANLAQITIPASVTSMESMCVGFFNGNPVSGFRILGVPGSAAEAYASANGFIFQNSAEPDVPVGQEGDCGENLTWKLEDGTLTISGTGDMWNYSWENPAPWEGQGVRTLVLEEGITSVGSYAFKYLRLDSTSLQFPDSLQSLGAWAFTGNNFTSLTLGPNLTSIGQNALTHNPWVEITVSEDNAAFVYQDKGLYTRDMARLTAVFADLGDVFVLPEGVITIDDGVFIDTHVRELQLSRSFQGFSSESCHFAGCNDLERITVPEGNTAFCSKDGVLFSADGRTLFGYPSAKQDRVYEIPFGTRYVSTQAIYSNHYLEELVIPRGFASWNGGADYCYQLKKVTVPGTVQRIADQSLGYISGEKVDGFTICGVSGSAAENYANANGFTFEEIPGPAENSCGENLTWKLENGVLTISGTGEMDDYIMTEEPTTGEYSWVCASSAPWGKESLQKVVIEKGVTSIGSYAFEGQTSLREVALPSSLKYIGDNAFMYCFELQKAPLPEGIREIGNNAFFNCMLTELYIPASLTKLGGSVFNGYSIQKLQIAPGNPAFAVKDNGLYSKDLTKLWLQHWSGKTAVIPDTVKTVDISVLLSLSNEQEIFVIGAQCDLRNVLQSVTFCTMLKEIQVKEGNPYHLAADGVLYEKDRAGLKLAAYPSKREASAYQVLDGTVKIASDAFPGTEKLHALVLPESLRELDWGAVRAGHMQEIYIPASVTAMSIHCIGYDYMDMPIPGFRIMGVPGSAAESYAAENGFEFVPVTQTVFTVHYDAGEGTGAPEDQQRTLSTALALSERIPTRPGYTFLGWDTDASAAMLRYKPGDLFAENADVTLYAVWIQGDVTASGICGDNLFWYVDDAGTLTVSGTGAMYDYTVSSSGQPSAPWADLNVNAIVVGEGVTQIGQFAFWNIRGLTTPPTLPTTLKRIQDCAFTNCWDLSGILVLPEGLESIGMSAFASCEKLTTVYVGANVQSIEQNAFFRYEGAPLRVLYAGSREQWEAIVDSTAVNPELSSIHYNARCPQASEGGLCGDALHWYYENGSLTIAGDGTMYDYTQENPAPWDSYGMEIRSVEVQERCASIGARAFWDCANLTTISLPRTVRAIGDEATLNCGKLNAVLYAGSRSDFNRITVGKGNEILRAAALQLGDKTYRITYHNIEDGDSNPNPAFGTNEADVTLAAAKRDGYTFGGWFSDEALTKKVTKIAKTNAEDMELWAKWTANSFTLEFKPNASGVTGKMPKVTGTTGTWFDLPRNTFQRKGYEFLGWYISAAPEAGSEASLLEDEATFGYVAEKNKAVCYLYAQWAPVAYTIVFDANGGEGTMADAAAVYDTALTLPENTFRREGYVFSGWNTKPDGKGTAYKAGASVKNLAAGGSATLYAVWKPGTYSIRFDPNGGTGTMRNQTLTYDKAALLSANAFKRTGYLFAGWLDADGNSYANKQSVVSLIPEGTLELTAQWTPISYTVKFLANGAEGTMANIVLTYDSPADQPALGFTRAGYRFEGWATSAGGKVVHAPEAQLSNLTVKDGGTVTLYAKWAPFSYTVVYDGNGATKGTMKEQTILCTKAGTLTKNAFSRTGYTFQGWSTQAGSPAAEYTNGQKNLFLSDTDGDRIVLYAVWTPVEYKLTYKNTTTGETSALAATYNIERDGEVGTPGTRPGCTFQGWYLDSKFKTPFPGFQAGSRTGNLTLYAKWDGTPTAYVIRFAPGKGTVTGKMADMAKRVSGVNYTLTKNAFKRAGYTFSHWALGDLALTDKAVVSNLPMYIPGYVSGDPIVLTAQWVPTSCKLTYKNLTAEELELVPAAYDIEHPVVLPILSRVGYDFGGWFLDSGFKKPVAEISGTGAKTVYAKWTAHKYIVHFDGNGATKGTTKDAAMTFGTAKALTGNGFSRTGFTFLGWATDPNAAAPEYKNQAKVLNLSSVDGDTVTLYAVWKAK